MNRTRFVSLEQDSDDFQRDDLHRDAAQRTATLTAASHSSAYKSQPPTAAATARFNDLLPFRNLWAQALTRWEQTFPAALTARKTSGTQKAAEQRTRSLEREKKREAERQARKPKLLSRPPRKPRPWPQHPNRIATTPRFPFDTALPQAENCSVAKGALWLRFSGDKIQLPPKSPSATMRFASDRPPLPTSRPCHHSANH